LDSLCKVVSLSRGGTFYLPKEARKYLGIPAGQRAKIAIYLSEDKDGKMLVLKVVR